MSSNLKIYLKHLSKNKLYAFVTIFGYAVSLMFVLLLGVYIRQELSVDQFHAKKDRIFRLYKEDDCEFAPPVGGYIKTQFPEVGNYCRMDSETGIGYSEAGQKFSMKYLLADSSFFSMFSFKLDNAVTENVLAAKNAIVVSRSFARKVFGAENPVGQEITIQGNNMQKEFNFLVTGVMEDFPGNTHFEKCDAIINFENLPDLLGDKNLLTSFGSCCFDIYFLAKPGANLRTKAPQILEMFKKDFWLYKKGYAKELEFEPLTDVYFSRSTGIGIRQNSKTLIMTYMGIVFLILGIAMINYINLTVAQTGFRGKETAIKKLLGSSHKRLIFQYISESIALSFFAALLAVFLAFLAEPYFNDLLNTRLNLISWVDWRFSLQLLALIILTGLFSGLIPAFVLNRFAPVEVVKGTFARKTKGTYSKILIGFQYCVAIVLLVCTWGISRQARFMRSYDTGFQEENIFWMGNTVNAPQKKAFSDVLKAIPGVQEVSYACGSPLDGGSNWSFSNNGKPVSFQEFIVDTAFFRLMGIRIIQTNAAFDKQGYYLNHQSLAELELPGNATSFKVATREYPILGIVKDFNFQSLYQQVGPVMIGQMDDTKRPWKVFVKLSGNNLIETVNAIKKTQAKFTGGIPMESGFVDDTINQWYQEEDRTARLVGAFTFLSIIISGMGIFAMSLYYIQQKVKEIGIRKVNGAKILEVMILLNKDFVKWVAIAFLIAIPIAWYAIHRWLENFAYKTELSWWIFASAGLLALGIALLTVSWQSWKAATRNPVEALRYE
jgi:putative ABC transport system permease protein